jgi:hypothetical protein
LNFSVRQSVFRQNADAVYRPYFSPQKFVRWKLEDFFKNHRTKPAQIKVVREALMDLGNACVTQGYVDGKFDLKSLPKSVRDLIGDPRTIDRYVEILVEIGAMTRKGSQCAIVGFKVANCKQGHETRDAILTYRKNARLRKNEINRRSYHKTKKAEVDPFEAWDVYHADVPFPVEYTGFSASDSSPSRAVRKKTLNSSLISTSYSSLGSLVIGAPDFSALEQPEMVPPPVEAFSATLLVPEQDQAVTPSSSGANSITLLPLTLLERRSELERMDDLLTVSPKDPDDSKAKSVDKSILKTLKPSAEKPEALPAMVNTPPERHIYRAAITRQRAEPTVSRETSVSAARDPDGRPILSAEELKRRLGPSSIIEKYCVGTSGVETPTAPIPPSPAQKNVYKPAFTAKKIEQPRHSQAMTEKSGLSPEIQAIIEKCQQQSREREAQKSVEIKILESPQMEFTPSPPPVPTSVPVPLGVSPCEARKTPIAVMPPQLPAPQQRLTHSAAAHLLSQHHEMPPEMVDRIVAIGATYTQAQQALSLTADAKQRGRIKKSPVGYFLKTMENLFHVKHGTG